ncbi:uncharacterized protein LOC125875582 [Solanum stenotomum]|uniref:uncharacterized protein LOC125875582 n=1 Tax=Solanum stenotomum TaxID=172797 RepID=UPI0020D0CF92|nr:uncharacterized protein LOC125875582 [Solanum stenotomum]
MTRGRGINRCWGGRGGITNKGGGGCKLPPGTSQKDVSESSIPTSQQVGLNQCIVSSHESSSQQIVDTSQEANAQQITTPENVGGQQEAHTSLDVGRQETPFSQNVGAQQETPTQDVSPEQTPASFESSNPQVRQDTFGGMKSLRVNGDTFFPHEAVRDVVLAFKKSFSGPWHCWSKVPEHVRDKWFNDFEKNYSFSGEDKVLIRKTFNRVGSERLSDSLGKAKRTFSRTKKTPKWIAQVH